MAQNSARAVVIDDTDSGIRYTGQGWFLSVGSLENVGSFGPPYQHTSHGTNVTGSLAYTFQGTSVQVLGTINLAKTSVGPSDPFWECFVDNVSINITRPVDYFENNWILCEQQDLADGQHELTVNVTTAGQTFWFDRIQYTPSPGLLQMNAAQNALGSTANMTQVDGSTVTISFTGTSISWSGSIPVEFHHDASSATYVVDGGPPVLFPLPGLNNIETTMYNQIFFITPNLTAGPHSLVVVYHGNTRQTPLTLDYLYVSNTSSSLAPTTSPISSSTTLVINTSLTTTIINPTSPQGRSNPATNIGAIIGSVIGGVSLIALVMFILWRLRGRKSSKFLHEAQPVSGNPALVVSLSNYLFVSHHISSTSNAKSALSGYNPDTIAETRAMRKAREQ
ncbi:hypothetical protein BDZ94DRAFT_1269735 [Collybia nuda]|uniref:Uncharacterized protein n=1 Tax=Collybia nuda TaxID=64659 RepID=A0A9P5XW34_9AGAR|nr:hypothetical protein BDZ94DRAFT_1269735 [Collybia nuda]